MTAHEIFALVVGLVITVTIGGAMLWLSRR